MEVEICLSGRSLQLWILPRKHWLLQVKAEFEGQDGQMEVERQEERGELSLDPTGPKYRLRFFCDLIKGDVDRVWDGERENL